jgi:hypothetical protein
VRFFPATGNDRDVPDVVVFARLDAMGVDQALEFCRSAGIGVVYDVDDALDLIEPGNPCYSSTRERLERYERFLEAADVVTVSTPELAEHLLIAYGVTARVLPNSVDPEEWPGQKELARPWAEHPDGFRVEQVRVGWSGGPTHFSDLGNVLDAIRDAQKRQAFKFVIQGITDQPSLDAMHADLFARFGKVNGKLMQGSDFGRRMQWFLQELHRSKVDYEFHPAVPSDQHAAKLAELNIDIGIAPLQDSPFNRSKSAIKYYEWAMCGAVVLASAVLPYVAEVPQVCKNSRQHWSNHLSALLDTSDEARASLISAQRQWVLATRNMELNVELWEQAYAMAAEVAQVRVA